MVGPICDLAHTDTCSYSDKYAVNSLFDQKNLESGGICHVSRTNNSLDRLEGEM